MGKALPLSENMFGKMRGRFDEMEARRIERTVAEECFYRFMSLSEESRAEMARRLDEVFKKVPGGWVLVKRGTE
jgi:hypothetical protein